jgi:hypothetical protein
MVLTREQTTKAVEELKANEWMALGGMSPEAQEFAKQHKNEIILNYRAFAMWSGIGVIQFNLQVILRLDPSYTLPEEEPEYLELDVDMEEDGLVFRTKEAHRFKIPTQPLYLDDYIFEGYKFEGHPKLHNHYFGYKNPHNNYIHYHQVSDRHIKVFATKVVYRKVG